MLVNPELDLMSVEDLSRRYSQSYVWYGGRIIFVRDFGGNVGRRIISFSDKHGFFEEKFEVEKLDISRPSPRWVVCDNCAYYVNYRFERQYSRGFTKENARIKPYNKNMMNILPTYASIPILEALYGPPQNKERIAAKDVEEIDKFKLLSPQLLLAKLDEQEVCVFYREKNIGRFGKVLEPFEQELKELIGDYENEPLVAAVRNPVQRAKKPADRRPNIQELEEILGRAEPMRPDLWGRG